MTLYQKFKKLNIDFSAIGLEQRGTEEKYFCTPKGARIIGWAGVDGIHCCFIRGFEEMVFAVSPMNTPGDYVHPIARSFEDLLRLLLACGSMDAIEQTHQWDEGQFDEYVATSPQRRHSLYSMFCGTSWVSRPWSIPTATSGSSSSPLIMDRSNIRRNTTTST